MRTINNISGGCQVSYRITSQTYQPTNKRRMSQAILMSTLYQHNSYSLSRNLLRMTSGFLLQIKQLSLLYAFVEEI